MNQKAEMLSLIQSWSARHRSGGETLGFVNGCFDLLHDGHCKLLQMARQGCDRLMVAVNSDESVRRRKGASRPVEDLSQRLGQIRCVCYVDFLISFDGDDPGEILRVLKPDFYFLGSDYRDQAIPGADECREVCFIERLAGVSTTEIIARRYCSQADSGQFALSHSE